MALSVNLRHLADHGVELDGELAVVDLDFGVNDELISTGPPLAYDLQVEKFEGGLLVQGRLRLPLQCHCVRCLKSFPCSIDLQHWSRHLPLEGEDAVTVVNDCVDLTPYVREDMLLEFPQHPLCNPECRGLPQANVGKTKPAGQPNSGSPAWSELNKLKF